MDNWIIFLIPVVAAFTGWLANRMALWFLFNPKKPWNIFGLKILGLVPANQEKMARSVSKLISNELVFTEKIESEIGDKKNLQKIMPVIEDHIEDFLKNRLATEMPMVGMFLGDKTIGMLKQAFLKELELLFPVIMKSYTSNLKASLNVEKMITSKISSFSSGNLNEFLKQNLRSQLRLIPLFGAGIGFLIGLILMAIFFLAA